MTTIYYFGCIETSGHYLWDPEYRSVRMGSQPWSYGIDDGLCAGRRDRLGDVAPEDQQEGVANLTHEHGWTALAFWDRSVDSRPGSHSTFVAEGTFYFEEMLALARAAFPKVWARYRFEITLRPETR